MTRFSRRSFVVGGGATLASVPAVLAALQSATPAAAATPAAPSPTDPYKFSLVAAADSPIPGGMVHHANKAAFPTLRGVAAFSLVLDPHALRQPHLHTNANELSCLVQGSARVGLVGPGASSTCSIWHRGRWRSSRWDGCTGSRTRGMGRSSRCSCTRTSSRRRSTCPTCCPPSPSKRATSDGTFILFRPGTRGYGEGRRNSK
jgi:Cupin